MKARWQALNLTGKFLLLTTVTIVAVMGGLVVWLSSQMRSDMVELVRNRSIVIQRQIEVSRAYIAGQYVAKIKNAGEGKIKIAQEHSAPDTVPFPATATREMAETLAGEGMFTARVISATPLNPANKPNGSWEEQAIKSLAAGEKEVMTVETAGGIPTFRRMTPDIIQNQACIACHTDKKMGEMVGAVSVAIPLTAAIARVDHNIYMLYGVAGFAAVLLGLVLFVALRSFVVRPIQRLREVMSSLTQGNLSARALADSADEVGQLAKSFNEMGETIERDVNASAQYEATFDAVSKAQAVIEFNLDGTIIKANENFLKTMGYSLDEVKGQHHRMFCEPAYASSQAYAEFWAKLNRGQSQVDVFRRLGKGGKEVWIQASYNPIPDAKGTLVKVVKFASDVTEEKQKALVKYATDTSTSNVLMCDRNLVITYINAAAQAKLKNLESEIRKVFPSFNADKIVGVCIDQFHQVPDKQRRILADPKNLPHRAEIKIGPLTLSLTVSAIMTDKGEYLGNTLEWADITAHRKAQVEVDRLISAAAAGQLNERIDATGFEGFFKDLSEGVNKMLDAVVTPLHEAQQVLTSLADNNLTKSMSGSYQGEFEQMKTSLNQALGNLAATVGAVREAVEAVSNGAEEITKGNEDLAQRTSEQAGSLEETSASMEEMTSTVKQNADNAKQANQLAIAARETADKGGAVTIRAVEAMGEINQSSKKIADIITVIDEIAFQTNLLALNAAVEAARAGEHGRGFAVVAAEVRNLAQRSATAAKEIKGLINESIQRVNDGSELVNQSGKTLEEIVTSVKRVSDIIAEITAASQEQASGIDQVNKAIMQMDETTQQNAALVEETTSASQSMKEQAKELMRQVAVFKVSGTGSAPQRAVPAPASHGGQASRPSAVKGGSPHAPKRGQASRADAGNGASPQPAGIAAGNGHDRRAKSDEFEEF